MRRPRIVLAHWSGLDFFGRRGLALLDEVGEVLDPEPLGSWDDPRADDLLGRAEVLLGHWGCPWVDGAVLDRAPDLGLVAYAAGTIKFTVGADVFARGVRVTSGAPANAEPVAEFTLAAILFANKDVWWQRDLLRDPAIGAGRQAPSRPVGNWDKTIGIVGASMVGRRTIELLAAFPRLPVLLYDPFVDAAEAESLGVTKVDDLAELCRRSDVLSIHAPDVPATRGMIGGAELAALRTGATVINTARGALVDTDALTAECETGRLSAVLDVTEPEPIPDDHVLRRLPNVFLTPHLAGSQGTELGRMTELAVEEIRRFAAAQPAINEVRMQDLERLA